MDKDLPGCFTALNPFRRLGKGKISSSSKTIEHKKCNCEHSSSDNDSSKNDVAAFNVCCGAFADVEYLGADKPPAYYAAGELVGEIYKPEVLEYIESQVDGYSDELRKLSLDIHDNPELMFKEFRTHDVLTSFMESHGFTVTRHYLDLETAWRAEYTRGKGGRVIGVNSEMDALPGIGHACGHNLIAICGVGIALALRDVLEKFELDGKIVLLGTPAEEGGGGKVILNDRGGYKEMDVCLMSHPGPGPEHSTGWGTSLAIQLLNVEYFGHTAHAAAAPWEGQNALDAAFLAYSAVSVLRQQIKPDHRVHGIVQGKNWAANIIPDYAAMHWIVRAPSAKEVDVLRERVKACIKGAAMAANCRVEIDESALPYYDLRQNSALGSNYGAVVVKKYGMGITPASGSIGGSTDFGNISYDVPSLHPMFAIPTNPNGGNHTALFTASARTPEAHEETLYVIKGLAHTGFRVLADDGFFDSVKKAYEEDKKERS